MNAQEAQEQYQRLKNELDTHTITLDDFSRGVQELKYQDHAGTWWAINPADGSWLKWDGSTWIPALAQQQPAAAPITSAPVQQFPGQPSPIQTPALKQPWSRGRKFAAGSIVCGIAAFAVFPIILGITAVVLGALSLKAKDKVGAIGIVLAAVAVFIDVFYLYIFQ